jgi:hypothetical protein
MPSINMQRFNWAYGNTGRLHTLPALGYVYISGESFKRVLNNLYSGKRQTLKSLMHQRAGKHAGHAALALLGINQKISFSSGERIDHSTASNPHTNNYNARGLKKFPARESHACLVDNVFIGFVIHS